MHDKFSIKSHLVTLQKDRISLKMLQMQGAEIRSKLKELSAINSFQLSASGFQLLCNAAYGVFSAEFHLFSGNRPKPLYYVVNLVLGTGTEMIKFHSHTPPLALRTRT